MANNQFHVSRDASHPWAMRTINMRDAVLRTLNDMEELRGKAIQCFAPDNDWANLEAAFGLSPGEGEAFFAELDSAHGALGDASAALRQFCDRVG